MKLANLFQKTLIVLLIIALPLQFRHIYVESAVEHQRISLFFTQILILLLIPTYLFLRFQTKNNISHEKKPINEAYLLLLILFLLLGTRQFFIPRETLYSHSTYLSLVLLLFIAILIAWVAQETKFKHLLLKSIMVSGLFQATIALIQLAKQSSAGLRGFHESIIGPNIDNVAKIDILGQKLVRSYGLFFHPNQLAAFLVVACATATYLLLTQQKHKHLYFAAILFLYSGLMATFSRAGILALFVFMITFTSFYIYREENKKSTVKSFAIIYMGLAIITMPFLTVMKERTPVGDKAVGQRLEYNSKALNLIKEYPVFGVGQGRTVEFLYPQTNLELWEKQPPHNFFLLVACEAGLIGLTLLLIFFFLSLKRLTFKILRDNDKKYAAFLAALLISILFMMMFDHYYYTLHQTKLLLWIIIGLILAETGNSIVKIKNG